MLEDKLEKDIKDALLSGDSWRVGVLRGLKSELLNVKIAKDKRDTGLSDNEIIELYAKEAKKRQDSADLYKQGGGISQAENELKEKELIESYLPPKLSDEKIAELIDKVIEEKNFHSVSDMGKIISEVKKIAGPSADGGLIAKLTKEKLQ